MGAPPADPEALLAARRPGYSLPGPLYGSAQAHALDLERVWQRQWVFACAEAEVAAAGDYVTLTVGAYRLLVLRGGDGELRALHNVCRHRGSLLCDAETGSVKRRIVCPYHQWTYHHDGRLAAARTIDPATVADPELALGRAHCAVVGGLVFVNVADTAPDLDEFRRRVEPYLQAYDLAGARVAHTSTVVEEANWKLVWENNRECYHCRGAHEQLCRTFPEAPLHSGGGSATELRATEAVVAGCESLGLPGAFAASDDLGHRVMRMALNAGATSMTMDGTPAVGVRFAGLREGARATADVGDLLLYHYPSTWIHVQADHALTFRVLPLSPTATELRTTWLVPGDAVEGVDYDLERLTEVWLATNAQDGALVERTQRGVASPAYRPGPYAPVEEEGVLQFVDWYVAQMTRETAR